MKTIFDLDALIKLMALAFGLAMFLGNLYAIIQHRRGKSPKGESGGLRTGRAYWLLAVGLLVAVWGGASLLT